MVRLDERGVSDIVVIAFMFILLVMAVTLLFGYNTNTLRVAGDRQMELKTNYLHRTLERTEVQNIQVLDAAAEQLVVTNPTVEKQYLKSWMENTLDFLRPVDHGVVVTLTGDNNFWRVSYPKNTEIKAGISSTGSVTITKAGGEAVLVNVKVTVFKL